MTASAQKLRVGVSIYLRQGAQSIWENGIFQNCAFLVQLLSRSPLVKKAVLVNGGDALLASDAMMLRGSGMAVINLTEALQTLDVVIEMSALLPEDWMVAFRQKGGRVVWMRVGNDYVIDIERAMFDKPPASLCNSKTYDAVWTLPEYERTCKDYFSLTTRAPVRIVPHIWSPYFFDKGISTLPSQLRYGYQPGKKRWRVCSFEPNVCMVKTSYFPMLICERAYRTRPDFLEMLRVCNTLHIKQQPLFESFARRLDVVNHGLASFEGRFAVYEFMAHFGDCIVSHHWENGQNYLYYEALYGGYPLIHNSEFIQDYGYYYPKFDVKSGASRLLHAFETHDENLEQYKEQAAVLLKQLDMANPGNVDAYSRELARLVNSKQ